MEAYQSLLQLARDRTGLEDFGSGAFLEGLEILTTALRREARLNALGETVLRERIVGHLSQRLQVEDWYRRHPEIDEQVIVSPLIGVSLPRTGSTVLSFLLAQDSNARSLRRWEASRPCPPPATVTGVDPRIEADLATQHAIGLKSHVPTGACAPAECQDLMALDFKSQIFQAFARIPSYSEWLLDADLSSTYLYQRRVLKLLQWGFPTRRWRLKCPTHLIYLEYLIKAFPDARLVMTHRDPLKVIPSVIEVYCDIAGRFTDRLDRRHMAELNVRHWSEGMRRALEFRNTPHNDARFFDIDFAAMNADPVATVRALYRWLGEPVSEAFEQAMTCWSRENAAGREPGDTREPADCGIDPARLCTLFADYSDRAVGWIGKAKYAHGH